MHCDHAVPELDARSASFERIKLNAKGKSVKVGIKYLIIVSEKLIHLNKEEQSRNTNRKELTILLSF